MESNTKSGYTPNSCIAESKNRRSTRPSKQAERERNKKTRGDTLSN